MCGSQDGLHKIVPATSREILHYNFTLPCMGDGDYRTINKHLYRLYTNISSKIFLLDNEYCFGIVEGKLFNKTVFENNLFITKDFIISNSVFIESEYKLMCEDAGFFFVSLCSCREKTLSFIEKLLKNKCYMLKYFPTMLL